MHEGIKTRTSEIYVRKLTKYVARMNYRCTARARITGALLSGVMRT
jgi:hypothetical protein